MSRSAPKTLAGITLAILIGPAAEAGIILNRSAEGFFQSTGEKVPDFATMGYFGVLGDPYVHRIYYLFDLASVSGPIGSAALRLELDRFFAGVDSLSFGIFGFDGNPANLQLDYADGNVAGAEIFNDLGSGASFGSGLAIGLQAGYRCTPTCSGTPGAPGEILNLELTQAALDAINAAAGGLFAVGLRLDDETAADLFGGFKAVTFEFPLDGVTRVAELVLHREVQEPATLVLLATGIVGAAWCRRRRYAAHQVV